MYIFQPLLYSLSFQTFQSNQYTQVCTYMICRTQDIIPKASLNSICTDDVSLVCVCVCLCVQKACYSAVGVLWKYSNDRNMLLLLRPSCRVCLCMCVNGQRSYRQYRNSFKKLRQAATRKMESD